MKYPINQACRRCRCTQYKCCSIVTQRGVRACRWHEPGLCDNPQCLVSEAQRLEKPVPDLAKASNLREQADRIRRGG